MFRLEYLLTLRSLLPTASSVRQHPFVLLQQNDSLVHTLCLVYLNGLHIQQLFCQLTKF